MNESSFHDMVIGGHAVLCLSSRAVSSLWCSGTGVHDVADVYGLGDPIIWIAAAVAAADAVVPLAAPVFSDFYQFPVQQR